MPAELAKRRSELLFTGALLLGALVALLAGVYGSVHDPASETTLQWFFTSTLHLKAWMTTLAVLFGIAQVLSAIWIYGRLRLPQAPAWLGSTHRIFGSLALLASIPVAYHCLWALGFEGDIGESRRFWHSIFGCAFYGAFVTKVLVVRSHSMPRWALPVIGGVLFAVLVVVWLTSSLWFFDTIGVEF